ncbi:MAG: tripartite tricarboxylate transporter TctB family protein [Alphaproteobacteria bacterium]|nr:tripartite tricarboxylate transporter TctB family protein [Alphaproteobacteria bacterium]
MNSSPRRTDLVFALMILAVAGITWREAARLAPAPFDPLGPKTVPIAICVGLVGLAGLMLLRLALGAAIGASRTSLITGLGDDPLATHAPRPWLAILAYLITTAYVVALSLPGISFLVATIGFIAALVLALGPRRPRDLAVAAAVAVGGGFVIDVLFRQIFAVDLP